MKLAREFTLSSFIFVLNVLFAQAAMAGDQAQLSKVDERATFLDGEWIGTGSFFLGKDWGNQIASCSEVKLKFAGPERRMRFMKAMRFAMVS